MGPMLVEILYFEGCPSYERLLPVVRRHAAKVGAEVALRRVENEAEAQAARFLGSPTVKVGGVDVEPGAEGRADYGLKCRLYRTSSGVAGVPDETLLEAALAAASTPG